MKQRLSERAWSEVSQILFSMPLHGSTKREVSYKPTSAVDMLPACSACGELGHTEATCKQLNSNVEREPLPPDFDQAGRDLLQSLLQPAQPCKRDRDCTCPLCDRDHGVLAQALLPSKYSPMSLIWHNGGGEGGAGGQGEGGSKEGLRLGGEVFVGGIAAAQDGALLRSRGVTHVVNCMMRPSLNVLDGMTYYDFSVSNWRQGAGRGTEPEEAVVGLEALRNARSPNCSGRQSLGSLNCSAATHHHPDTAGPGSLLEQKIEDEEAAAASAAAVALFAPVMEFVSEACEAGGSVLIHCFAGAHRAGTTGTALLMHKGGLGAEAAITVAQQMRPVIDPKAHGDLFTLLELLEEGLKRQRQRQHGQ